MPVAFIPCVGARDEATSKAISAALGTRAIMGTKSLHRSSDPDATACCVGEGVVAFKRGTASNELTAMSDAPSHWLAYRTCSFPGIFARQTLQRSARAQPVVRAAGFTAAERIVGEQSVPAEPPVSPIEGLRAIELTVERAPLLQQFFDDNPAYFLATSGEPSGPREAFEEIASEVPPDMPFTKKWVYDNVVHARN